VTAYPLKKLLKENMVTQAINSGTKRIYHRQLIFEICAEICSNNNRSLHPLHMCKQKKVKYILDEHFKLIELQLLFYLLDPNSLVKLQIVFLLAKNTPQNPNLYYCSIQEHSCPSHQK